MSKNQWTLLFEWRGEVAAGRGGVQEGEDAAGRGGVQEDEDAVGRVV